ncbi:MAG TPA: hypothetical protein VF977_08260 [Candidatus Binatia bacterium]|jgi:hypothetical protein
MITSVYILVAAIMVLMTLGRVVFRPAPKGIDWALEVAFIRLEFPPDQRVVAQQLAAGLAEIVGMKIKQLTPENNLSQIAEWAENHIYANDLITLFVVAFNVKCDADTTFRDLVEKVARKKAERGVAVAQRSMPQHRGA